MITRRKIWLSIALVAVYVLALAIIDNRAAIFGSGSAHPAAATSSRENAGTSPILSIAPTRTVQVAGGTITQYKVQVGDKATNLYSDFPSNGGYIVGSLPAHWSGWVDCQITAGGQTFYRVPFANTPNGLVDLDSPKDAFAPVIPLDDCGFNGK